MHSKEYFGTPAGPSINKKERDEKKKEHRPVHFIRQKTRSRPMPQDFHLHYALRRGMHKEANVTDPPASQYEMYGQN